MFNNATGIANQTIDDIKKLAIHIRFLSQIVTILYLLIAVIIGTGIVIANAILLAISAAYFIFDIILYYKDIKNEKLIKASVTQIYKWTKRLVKFVVLGFSVYGVLVVVNEPATLADTFSLILLIAMVALWVIDFFFAIFTEVVKARIDLFMNALKMDVEPLLKANNFIQKIRGLDVEEEIVPASARSKISKIAERWNTQREINKIEKKAAKAKKIAESKARRREKIQAEKEAKAAAKQAKQK